jgi:hypothetical protein
MKTFGFVTDALGNDEPIIVQSPCTRVVIYEDGQLGTADYKVRVPKSTDYAVTRPAGSKTEITAPEHVAPSPFQPGEIIGYVAAASGTLQMVQEEY